MNANDHKDMQYDNHDTDDLKKLKTHCEIFEVSLLNNVP